MARITFISRMTCKLDMQPQLDASCRRLEQHAKANKPGTPMFEFFRLRELYRSVVLESFRDEASEHLHMNSKMLGEVAPAISACVDGTWVREYFHPFT